MELADERASRPRRANAGNRMQELLEQGLDNEEEEILRAFSDASSDTSFTTVSGEETMDEIDSDFSDEEIIGVLEGEVVETEESVWREERKERRKAKNKLLSRSRHFTDQLINANKVKVKRQQQEQHAKNNISQNNNKEDVDNDKHAKRSRRRKKDELHHRHHNREAKQEEEEKEMSEREEKTLLKDGSSESEDYTSSSDVSNNDNDDDDDKSEEHDLRSAFRQRPAPTIPLAERMQATRERAAQVRQAMRMESVYTKDVNDSSNGNNTGKMSNQSMNYMQSFNMGKQTRVRRRRSAMYGTHNKNVGKPLEYDNLFDQDNVNNFHPSTAVDSLLLIQNRRVIAYTGHAPFQRVQYRSGRSILNSYGVPTIISFSHHLPPVLQLSNRK